MLSPGWRRRRQQRGIVLIAVAASLLLLMAGIGLGIDLNRLLISQRALRAAAEASALAAALEFDGTAEGERRGRARAGVLWKEHTSRLGNPPMALEYGEEGIVRVTASASTDLSLLRTVVVQRSVPLHVAVRAQAANREGHRSAEVLR